MNDMMSDAEWEVLRVVWAQKKTTSREIIDILRPKYQWSSSTVKTLIKRLVDKKILRITCETRPFYYESNVSQKELSTQLVRLSMEKICHTKQAEVIGELLREIPLSYDHIDELQKILEERRSTAVQEVQCECLKGQCECRGGQNNES